jgi:hypothetical protein
MLVHLSQEQGHHCEEKERVEEYIQPTCATCGRIFKKENLQTELFS